MILKQPETTTMQICLVMCKEQRVKKKRKELLVVITVINMLVITIVIVFYYKLKALLSKNVLSVDLDVSNNNYTGISSIRW